MVQTIHPDSPQDKATVDALWRLQKMILDTHDFTGVVSRIVNSILSELGYLELGYRILVLTLVDQQTQTLQRVALSQTAEATKAVTASPIPFEQIAVPLTATDNLLIQALQEKKVLVTHDWPDIFRPVLSDEAARTNQRSAGISTSMLYPLVVNNEAIGVMIFSMIKQESDVSTQEQDLLARFCDIVGLAVQNTRLYSSLLEANQRLQQIDSMKDNFVSLASHELRTPMTAIKSYLWMVLQQRPDVGPLTEKQKQYLHNTYMSTERLITLVNDMLNVSRIEAGRLSIDMKRLDIIKTAQECITEIQPTATEQGITVTLETPPGPLPLVSADSNRIKEVFMNLLGNSLKFTPPGGTITIALAQQHERIQITVTDTGVGIKQEDMPKLFQKFGMIEGNYLHIKPNTQGTGLGLFITKSIIELHGGEITVTSAGENKGTTFTFTLTIANE